MHYVTPRPPVYEMDYFPQRPEKYSIDAFLAWSGYVAAQKVPNVQAWQLKGPFDLHYGRLARPGDAFVRRVRTPDVAQPVDEDDYQWVVERPEYTIGEQYATF